MHTIALKQLTRGLLCLAVLLPLACPAAPLGVQDGALVVAVEPGDTLFNIASDYLLPGHDWRDLQRFNQIRSPYRLRPCARLRIPLAWAATEPSSARVLFANGQITRILGPHATIPLKPGMLLPEGSRISSAPGASATLELVDHSRIRVLPDTTLVLAHLQQYRHTDIIDTVIRFSRGQVESSVDPAHRGIGRYEVNSPLAVTGVRGTQFRVGLQDNDTQMTNEVLKGVVAVQGAGSSLVSAVTAGQGTIVGPGGKVQAPRALLPAPSLQGIAILQPRPIARFAYAALPGAVSYRAIVARDRAIDDILLTGSFKNPVAKFTGLPDGKYYLAVSGVDADGLEGRRQVVAFETAAHPQTPVAVAPPRDTPVSGPRVEFDWGQVANAGGYHFQLARAPSFAAPLRDERLTGTRLRLADIAPGRYYWRVASIGRDGHSGAFSAPLPLAVTIAPELTAMQAQARSPAAVQLSWAADATQAYRVELARDPDFTMPISSGVTHTPDWRLAALPSGTYYVRVNSLDADGFHGISSAPQRIVIDDNGDVTPNVRLLSQP